MVERHLQIQFIPRLVLNLVLLYYQVNPKAWTKHLNRVVIWAWTALIIDEISSLVRSDLSSQAMGGTFHCRRKNFELQWGIRQDYYISDRF